MLTPYYGIFVVVLFIMKQTVWFLLHLPGHSSTLTPTEFSECAAALLCLPSTACQEKLGYVIG